MAEPKKRLTSARSGNRRSHLALKAKKIAKCAKCNSPVMSHFACGQCGFYNGKDILKLEEKEQKKLARKKEQEENE